ncbi:hypothetical protein H9Y04_07695 [Streptomyces sp. TRM66268-LWL]|uniref:Lipoprotein n=1 Tax=Streptomyces polyasparticus TaxID=2767826 RepID=A0ABR7SBQ8_9ACTN|nr:hypothetical protein [Streptomyces polyasparticus]MBC9712454.1 hypothetical protein [Streptomyces polyasparticus]
MGDKIVRTGLVIGVVVLALLLLLAMCGGKQEDGSKGGEPPKKPAGQSRLTQLDVPAAYDSRRGWEVSGVSEEYALAPGAKLLAYLQRADGGRFRLRAMDARTGRTAWTSEAWRPLADEPGAVPRLAVVAKDGREYFATWSYGKLGDDPLSGADRVLSFDLYDAVAGTRQRVELPWPTTPSVSASGPGLVVGVGTDSAAVVDPVTGRTTTYKAGDLKYPAGCKGCRRLTEVMGVTGKGPLVSGDGEFWVRGAWHGRKVAPKGGVNGVAVSVSGGQVLARWDRKPDKKQPGEREIWAVHDGATGKVTASAECAKPALRPGRYPAAAASPDGRYLIAGHLAFDLQEGTGHCFASEGGTKPLTLATVTDAGLVYGATGARSADDAWDGGGTPVSVRIAVPEPEAFSGSSRLPVHDLGGVGIFRWTDSRDVRHLLGYVKKG